MAPQLLGTIVNDAISAFFPLRQLRSTVEMQTLLYIIYNNIVFMCFNMKNGQILESCTVDCYIGWAGYQTSFYATDQICKTLITNNINHILTPKEYISSLLVHATCTHCVQRLCHVNR